MLGLRRSPRLPLALGTGLALMASMVVMATMSPAQALGAPTGLAGATAQRDHTHPVVVRSRQSDVVRGAGRRLQLLRLPGLHGHHGEHAGRPDQGAADGRPVLAGPLGLREYPFRLVEGRLHRGGDLSSRFHCPPPVASLWTSRRTRPSSSGPAYRARRRTPCRSTVTRTCRRQEHTTKSTSFVVPDPLTAGDWFWTVTASKGTGFNSLPSDVEKLQHRRAACAPDHLPGRRHQPDAGGCRLRLDAGARRQDLRPAGRAGRRLQQHLLDRDRDPVHALLASDHAQQRPVLVAGPGGGPGRSAKRLDPVAQWLHPPMAGSPRRRLPDRDRRHSGSRHWLQEVLRVDAGPARDGVPAPGVVGCELLARRDRHLHDSPDHLHASGRR